MSFTRSNINRNSLLGVISLTVFLLILLLPATVEAAKYFVLGRVYSALSLAEDQEPPNNPLSDVPPEEVVGEDLFAVVPRNLVEVRVIAESDGSELGRCKEVSLDGGYYIDFDAASGGISVRFVVEELATNKILLNSDPVELSEDLPAWPPECNTRYLLVPEGVAPEGVIEIGNDREYAPGPAPPYTAIFTRVGKIELETEVGGTPYRQISTSTGLVTNNVVDSMGNVAQPDIPKYQDAPLGGKLYIFGAFSKDLYDMPGSTIYYRIRIEPGSTYMDAPLFKTKYTVDFNLGTVNTERVQLGPVVIDGYPNCYGLTPIAVSNNEFWSFPDLVALWPTGYEGLNGDYTLHLEAIDYDGVTAVPLAGYVPISDFTDLRLHLDNTPPVAQILPLGTGDELHPTPRVYTPAPPNPGISGDLTDTFEGTWSADYGGTADPTCMILNLEPPTVYLAFNLKAYHANGYLRRWYFKYKRNDMTGYQTHIGKIYVAGSMVDDPDDPPKLNSLETDVHGFPFPLTQHRYLYLKSTDLQPDGGTDLGSCAYRFLIGAFTRTTDGYHYLRYAWDEDVHYLQR